MEINKVFDLIEANDLDQLKQILDNGFDVNACDQDGYGLVHLAVDVANEQVLKLLLARDGCKVNRSTHFHRLSPLHFAAQDGKTSLVAILVDSGAEINGVNHTNCTPLYFAVCANHIPTVQLLLARGADPNIADTNNMSPLLQAVSISRPLTALLLDGKALTSDHCRELHSALLANKADVAHLILDRLTPLSPNRIGRTPLQNAVQHISTEEPNEAIELIKRMVELGEDVNVSNHFGTPLHLLILRNMFTTNLTDHITAEAMFKFLVSLDNCQLNTHIAVNNTGTPLTLAFKRNKYRFVQLLIRAGADIKSCQLSQFKYTRSADSVLKLLFYCGFHFDDSFQIQSRPSSPEDIESFDAFNRWLTNEKSKVMSLKNLIRIFFRNSLNKRMTESIKQLDVPDCVRAFLLFDHE